MNKDQIVSFFKERISSVFIPTLAVSLLANWLFLVYGYGSPDNLNEGPLYQGAPWALSIGRWAIGYINLGTLNMVMPIFNITVSTLCCCLVCLMLEKVFSIRNKFFLALTSISLAVAQAAIVQHLYIYMDLAYSWALLFSSLSAFLILCANRKWHYIPAAFALALALGGYQTYIGFTAAIIMMALILKLLQGESIRNCLKIGLCALLTGAGGCALYFGILKFLQWANKISMSDYSGADEISLFNILSHLGESIKSTYLDFFNYYFSTIAYRHVFFIPLCAVGVILYLYSMVILAMRKEILRVCVLTLLLATVPVCMNVITIIFPDRSINFLMSHQMQLAIPFIFAWAENGNIKFGKKLFFTAVALLGAATCWCCTLAAYATHASIVYVYQYMERYSATLLDRIYESGDYSPDVRILFAGVPDEVQIQKMNRIYQYGYKWAAIFWESEFGVLTCWPSYFRYYCFTDIGTVSSEEYHQILQSSEFANMECYPGEDSIQLIDDILVVKIEDDPPCN